MSTNTDYQKSLARCIAYAATLRADNPCFRQNVEIRHEDGSLWYLRNAFYMPDPDDKQWVWVITEHFGEQVFAADEITFTTFPAGPAQDYRRHERCDESGYTNPYLVECQCGDCSGHLYVDAKYDKNPNRAMLICDVCKCAYQAAVEKKPE